MMNLYGGTGMGSSGMGVGSGGGLSLQQLMAMTQGQGGGMNGPTMTNPFQQGGGPTPLAGYIGAPQPQMMGAHPMNAPVQNPQPQMMGAGMGGAAGTNGLMQLLAQLRGGQTGVAPGAPNGQPSMAAGLSPAGMAQQVSSNLPIGAAGSPSAPMPPPVPTGGGSMGPGFLQWLQSHLQNQQAPQMQMPPPAMQ